VRQYVNFIGLKAGTVELSLGQTGFQIPPLGRIQRLYTSLRTSSHLCF